MNDFFKNISNAFTERAKSPFYSTIIFSWLLWNWRIVFVILFTSKFNLEGQNLSDFITSNYYTYWNCYIGPLITATIFLFILPQIDLLILKYTEELKGKRRDIRIEKGRKHKVDGDTYYDLKFDFENLKSQVLTFEKDVKKEQAISNERSNEIKKLRSELSESTKLVTVKENDFRILNDRYNDVLSRDKTVIFQGRWQLEYTRPQDTKPTIEDFEIISNQYVIIRNNHREHKFDIKYFYYDSDSQRVHFLKYLVNRTTEDKDCSNDLNIVNKDLWEGTENYSTSVTYRRIKPT